MARQWGGWGRIEIVQGEGGGRRPVQSLPRGQQQLRIGPMDGAVRIEVQMIMMLRGVVVMMVAFVTTRGRTTTMMVAVSTAAATTTAKMAARLVMIE